jgi:hypothetical protein
MFPCGGSGGGDSSDSGGGGSDNNFVKDQTVYLADSQNFAIAML